MLHAHRVAFSHPITGAEVDISSRCPRDMARILRQLGMAKPGVFDSKRPSPDDSDHEAASDAVGEE